MSIQHENSGFQRMLVLFTAHYMIRNKHNILQSKVEVKGKLVGTLFREPQGAHLLFTKGWTGLLNLKYCRERVASPLHHKPVTFPAWASTHLYTWVERSKLSKVLCLWTQHMAHKGVWTHDFEIMSPELYCWATHVRCDQSQWRSMLLPECIHRSDFPCKVYQSHRWCGSRIWWSLETGGQSILHPIHWFELSDWLKDGHMTWTIFDNVCVWKLIHVCYFFIISLTLDEAATAA